jgi:hypothetical protein
MATFTLVDTDRQWFKSEIGVAGKEDPRDLSFVELLAAAGRGRGGGQPYP